MLMYACVGGESPSVARLAKAGAGSEAVSKSAQTHTELPFPPCAGRILQVHLGLDVFIRSAWINHNMLRTTRVMLFLSACSVTACLSLSSVKCSRPGPVLSNQIRSRERVRWIWRLDAGLVAIDQKEGAESKQVLSQDAVS